MNYRFLGKPPANVEHWMKTHEPTPPGPTPSKTASGVWLILKGNEANKAYIWKEDKRIWQYGKDAAILAAGEYVDSDSIWRFGSLRSDGTWHSLHQDSNETDPAAKHLTFQTTSLSLFEEAQWYESLDAMPTVGGVWYCKDKGILCNKYSSVAELRVWQTADSASEWHGITYDGDFWHYDTDFRTVASSTAKVLDCNGNLFKWYASESDIPTLY